MRETLEVKIKSVGQECPTHTGSLTSWKPVLVARGDV